ncbi:VRR-NUC domain-containing protein [Gordonia amicalis]|uniref:VRR-NUC domain-containing protein n=1 Tax=Gordonia amicalis TaxID=89053 RepID=UPI0022B42A33|nr:VRR-NUC domain-containing protein [Gordonia amicalis]MCZ4652721.1 VRR-NUC domain-containing protein [Gordonia amicalis]
MSTTRPKERIIERHLVDRCRELGVMCLKFTSPGHIGVPDRLLLGHDASGVAVTLFVEVKRPGGKPRPSQINRITEMRDHGAHAVIASTKAEVNAVLADYFTAPTTSFATRDPHAAPLPQLRAPIISGL